MEEENKDPDVVVKENLMKEVEKNPDEAVFCVPSMPPPSAASSKQQQIPSLDYTAPQWTAPPPQPEQPDSESILDQEGHCDHYFLEVIKNGAVVDKIKLLKEFVTFGRLAACDILCEHPSLSRYHSVLQYSGGTGDEKYPRGFYLFDLGSTHGTFVNKNKIEPHKYARVEVESVIKFGMSTRLYILHGPKPAPINDEDLKINLTHDQMKKIKEKYDRIAIKLRIRKELAEEEEASEWRQGSKGIDWGLSGETGGDEDDDEGGENPFAEDLNQADESFYSDDPKKALKAYFDRENDELEYEIEELGPGKYKCRIRLPILNDFGEYMYAECQTEGKKKECQAQCALEACRILNSQGVLRPREGESAAKRRKKKNWQSNDYYDSDEDTYLDRTGDIEKKRQKRMEADGGTSSTAASSKSKVHTFDSIKDELRKLIVEKTEIDGKLNKCKDVFKAVGNDDIDDYISSLKACEIDTITRAKLKRRLVEIGNEIVKFEKLLSVAKPSDFDANKWRADVEERAKQGVTQAPPAPPPKPPSAIETVKKKTQPVEKIVEKQSIPTPTQPVAKPVRIEATVDKKMPVEKKADNEPERPYEDNKDYAIWMPPKDQTGDGKTKLNEKFGY